MIKTQELKWFFIHIFYSKIKVQIHHLRADLNRPHMGRRKNRRGRIEGNCGLLPILLNFFSVRFRERKQDKKEYFPLKKQCKACFDRNFSKSARIWSRFCRDCPHGVQKPMVSSFLAKERILRV